MLSTARGKQARPSRCWQAKPAARACEHASTPAPCCRPRHSLAPLRAGPDGLDRESTWGDSARAASLSPLQAGAPERQPGEVLLDRYTVSHTLGEGTSGVTYEAVDATTGLPVAVKELALGRLKSWKQFELFEREAATLRSLQHPNIAQYVDYREAGGGFFLVQELADGPTLAAMVARGARFDEAEVERIARELLGVLRYLGSRRPPVIHRDIKPENIVLAGGRPGGRVLLVDFGGVQDALAAGSDAFGSTIIGTAGYMPPEQFGGAATPASDLYALGGVLLYLLSGRAPGQFRSERLRLAFEQEVAVGARLRGVLRGLLEPIAEDRLTVAQALDLLDGKPVRGFTPTADASTSGRAGGGALGRQAGGASSMREQELLRARYYTDMAPLARPWRTVSASKPARSRVTAEVVDGTLMVEIPPEGFGTKTVFSGSFAVAWNVFVGVWTAGALAGGGFLFALFSIPFWFAGASLVKDVALAALTRESLMVAGDTWSLTQEVARISKGVAKFVGRGLLAAEGETLQLRGAKVVTTMIVNGEPRTAIELVEGGNTYKMGEALSLAEQEYVAAQINRHLERVSGDVDIENDLYPSTDAQIVTDSNYRHDGVRRGKFSSRLSSWDD